MRTPSLIIPLLFLAIASSAASPLPVFRAETTRSLDGFGQCFVRAEDRRGRAWAFVPSEGGGTFINAADGNAGSYRLKVQTMAAGNAIGLFAAANRVDLIKTVEQCR